MEKTSEDHYESKNPESSDTIELGFTNADKHDFQESYNIPPTNSALIVYLNKDKDEKYSFSYKVEVLKFGLLPVWAKPQDSTLVKTKNGQGKEYSREVQGHQSKYFNCRKESLAKNQPVWNEPRKYHRCVVPIQGYFEWLKTRTDKVPYYIHSPNTPLLFLAGLYSHNTQYNDTELVPKGDSFFSSFTIVTGPALKKDSTDLSWLHSRKPIMIRPGTTEWFDWLDPTKEWDPKLLETSLNTEDNIAFDGLTGYKVAKSVGNPTNKTKDVIKEEKKSQMEIGLFFNRKPKVKSEEKTGLKPEPKRSDSDQNSDLHKPNSDEHKDKKAKTEAS